MIKIIYRYCILLTFFTRVFASNENPLQKLFNTTQNNLIVLKKEFSDINQYQYLLADELNKRHETLSFLKNQSEIVKNQQFDTDKFLEGYQIFNNRYKKLSQQDQLKEALSHGFYSPEEYKKYKVNIARGEQVFENNKILKIAPIEEEYNQKNIEYTDLYNRYELVLSHLFSKQNEIFQHVKDVQALSKNMKQIDICQAHENKIKKQKEQTQVQRDLRKLKKEELARNEKIASHYYTLFSSSENNIAVDYDQPAEYLHDFLNGIKKQYKKENYKHIKQNKIEEEVIESIIPEENNKKNIQLHVEKIQENNVLKPLIGNDTVRPVAIKAESVVNQLEKSQEHKVPVKNKNKSNKNKNKNKGCQLDRDLDAFLAQEAGKEKEKIEKNRMKVEEAKKSQTQYLERVSSYKEDETVLDIQVGQTLDRQYAQFLKIPLDHQYIASEKKDMTEFDHAANVQIRRIYPLKKTLLDNLDNFIKELVSNYGDDRETIQEFIDQYKQDSARTIEQKLVKHQEIELLLQEYKEILLNKRYQNDDIEKLEKLFDRFVYYDQYVLHDNNQRGLSYFMTCHLQEFIQMRDAFEEFEWEARLDLHKMKKLEAAFKKLENAQTEREVKIYNGLKDAYNQKYGLYFQSSLNQIMFAQNIRKIQKILNIEPFVGTYIQSPDFYSFLDKDLLEQKKREILYFVQSKKLTSKERADMSNAFFKKLLEDLDLVGDEKSSDKSLKSAGLDAIIFTKIVLFFEKNLPLYKDELKKNPADCDSIHQRFENILKNGFFQIVWQQFNESNLELGVCKVNHIKKSQVADFSKLYAFLMKEKVVLEIEKENLIQRKK